MNDTVECPYCEHDNDMTDGLIDLPSDNMFDHECTNCGEEFEVVVEFEPSYYSNKIEYANCEKCGKETREPKRRGKIFPYPKCVKENTICGICFHKGIIEDFESEK